eukprot:1183695-Prorocentrum_minimum.AAC.1
MLWLPQVRGYVYIDGREALGTLREAELSAASDCAWQLGSSPVMIVSRPRVPRKVRCEVCVTLAGGEPGGGPYRAPHRFIPLPLTSLAHAAGVYPYLSPHWFLTGGEHGGGPHRAAHGVPLGGRVRRLYHPTRASSLRGGAGSHCRAHRRGHHCVRVARPAPGGDARRAVAAVRAAAAQAGARQEYSVDACLSNTKTGRLTDDASVPAARSSPSSDWLSS